MIVKEKILIEVDSYCISGVIYPYETCVEMMKQINRGEVEVGIVGNEELKDKAFFSIINPQMIVDINDDNRTMYVLVDIDIDNKKYSKEELELFNTLPWRLGIEGDGDVNKETDIVENYVFKKVYIEFISKELYNEVKNSFI